MSRPIGYYVHHHGAGHAARFAKIAAACTDPVVAISQLDLADASPGAVRLSSDVVEHGTDPTAGGALHWAPVGDGRSAERALTLGTWLAQAQPIGLVADVSVEAALMARLFGVPTVVVRQHGDRTDDAHVMAYRSARRLLAPYPAELEHCDTPMWICHKTDYVGFIGHRRSELAMDMEDHERVTPEADDVVVLWGAGGGELTSSDLEGIVAAARPGRVWFAGSEPFDVARLGATPLGWVDDVAHLLRRAPTVVASAGNNVVADAATAGSALVVVPQARPFDEQIRHAQSLEAAGAAAVRSPLEMEGWPHLLDTARRRRSTLAGLARLDRRDHDGASLAADTLRRSFPQSAAR